MLDKKSILNSDDLPREKITVPQWGGDLFIRTLSGSERDDFEQSCVNKKGKNKEANLTNIRARLAVLTICDESGTRLFGAGDVEALGKKSAKALDLIFDVASRLNGLGQTDIDDLSGN